MKKKEGIPDFNDRTYFRKKLSTEKANYYHKKLDELIECYNSSIPDPLIRRNNSATNNFAQRAIYLSGRLHNELAGWADHHVIGTHIIKHKAKKSSVRDFVPELTGQKEYYAPANTLNISDFQSIEQRAAITNILKLLDASGGPPNWITQLTESLTALDMGKVTPLVSPKKTKRKGDPFTLDKIKWLVVQNVHILWGNNRKKLWAQAEVAGRIGVDKDTLKKWEQDILRRDARKKKTLHVLKSIARYFDEEIHPAEEGEIFMRAYKEFPDEIYNIGFYELKNFSLKKIGAELRRAGFRTKASC